MEGEFRQCPNGHYYQGATCPYCKSSGNVSGSSTSGKTQIFGGADSPASAPYNAGGGETRINNGMGVTSPMNGGAPMGGNGMDGRTIVNPASNSNASAQRNVGSRTVFGGEDEGGMPGAPTTGYRTTRKLVGWLVTYSLDPMGVDFKLYEGRNIIGRSMDCNITVNDEMVSSEHAVLLYRANKYSITDRQSSHGTFVNGSDIDLEPMYLEDGDKIRVGKTEFLFRKSF